MSDKTKAVLLILAIGTLCPAALYLAGLRLLGTICIAFIPFAFTCWGLSHIFVGSRSREICAHLTDEEREQLNDMARAYGRRIGFRFLVIGIVFLFMVVLFSVMFFNPIGPSAIVDFVFHNQLQVVGIMLGTVALITLFSLPAGIRQFKLTNNFLLQTEHARRKGYSA